MTFNQVQIPNIYDREVLIKIKRSKSRLEKKLKIKLEINNHILITGEEINIFLAEKILEAIQLGFSIPSSLLLIDENYVLENLNIKDLSRKKDLTKVKGRIIGKQGKTIRILSELSDCEMKIKDNIVSIIGPAEKIKETVTAIQSLIRGSKQSNIYSFLERQRKKPKVNIELKQ